MSTAKVQGQERWRDMIAFLDKVLGTGSISKRVAYITGCIFQEAEFEEAPRYEANLDYASKKLFEYEEAQVKIDLQDQANLLKKLLEADSAEGMQQLVNDGVISARDVNRMLETNNPAELCLMVYQQSNGALHEQEEAIPDAGYNSWQEYSHRELKFFKTLLSSDIITWTTAEHAYYSFENANHHEFVPMFNQYSKLLPRKGFASLMSILESALQAESSADLEYMVKTGAMHWNDVNEMLYVLGENPDEFLAYIQSKECRDDAIEGHKLHQNQAMQSDLSD